MDHRGHGELYEAKYLKTKRELDDIDLQIAELKKEQLENDISFTIGTSEADLQEELSIAVKKVQEDINLPLKPTRSINRNSPIERAYFQARRDLDLQMANFELAKKLNLDLTKFEASL